MVAYGTRVVLAECCEDVIERVRRALTEQGFVILAELNLQEVMQVKLGVAMPAQVVLGVCRRPVAEAALVAEP